MKKKKKKQKRQQAAESNDSLPGQTLFVCVRDRAGKGASCAGRGARSLLKNMTTILEQEEIGAEELTVRPCGCLGLCKQGPVMVSARGDAAREKKPPKAKKQKRGVYTRVEAEESRGILREVLRPPMPLH